MDLPVHGAAPCRLLALRSSPLSARAALDGRLHWASTETAAEYAGHIEGALAAGERAARAVLAAPGRPNTRNHISVASMAR
ncbi:FAD-dependent oxidoreductase [Streptomyces sp. NPDC007991]|uniref:FAD-dependent oxidoreductase n=1 Tax=Streptomyces sp. NPDC007991 TaxID=3364803 RepID=UPI0036EA97CC